MAERPSFDRIYLDHAINLAARSECTRLQVGCVIASLDGRYIFGQGYNGGPAGLVHTCTGEVNACGCLHAEDNAVTNCTAPRSEAKIVLVTNAPCVPCATRLVNLGGVRRVLWLSDYRIMAGAALLARAGIDARRWAP